MVFGKIACYVRCLHGKYIIAEVGKRVRAHDPIPGVSSTAEKPVEKITHLQPPWPCRLRLEPYCGGCGQKYFLSNEPANPKAGLQAPYLLFFCAVLGQVALFPSPVGISSGFSRTFDKSVKVCSLKSFLRCCDEMRVLFRRIIRLAITRKRSRLVTYSSSVGWLRRGQD